MPFNGLAELSRALFKENIIQDILEWQPDTGLTVSADELCDIRLHVNLQVAEGLHRVFRQHRHDHETRLAAFVELLGTVSLTLSLDACHKWDVTSRHDQQLLGR